MYSFCYYFVPISNVLWAFCRSLLCYELTAMSFFFPSCLLPLTSRLLHCLYELFAFLFAISSQLWAFLPFSSLSAYSFELRAFFFPPTSSLPPFLFFAISFELWAFLPCLYNLFAFRFFAMSLQLTALSWFTDPRPNGLYDQQTQ